MRFKNFIETGDRWQAHIVMRDWISEAWRTQDFSPFNTNESFNSPITINIKVKSPGKFVTEFNVEDNLYSFIASIYVDFVEVSFALNNNPLNIANLNSKNYQGTLGSGIFRSIEKLFELYDVEKWEVLAFKTPKTIKDTDGKPIPNPLVKFYDSKYLQRLICDKLFAAEFLDRKESSGMVIWAFKLE